VGVNQRGQVTGNAGVGVGTSVGNARVGAGVGTGTVLYDPAQQPAPADPVAPAQPPAGQPADEVLWRDSQGRLLPACKVEGRC
jgi:hypothetical protein